MQTQKTYKHPTPQSTMTKKRSSKKKSSINDEVNIQEKVLDNLVALQRVHTNLAEKFDGLSKEISSLLKLFEGAAKTFANSPVAKTVQTDKAFLDKIDKLMDQNKTIAKGLTLMGEQMRDKMFSEPPESKSEKSSAPAPPTTPSAPAGFTPSMASGSRPLPKF